VYFELPSRRRGERAFDPAVAGGPLRGLGDPPAAACRHDERRILRPVEPPPGDMVRVEPRHLRNPRRHILLHRLAYDAYRRMKQAAEADGVPAQLLTINSGYRSVDHQRALWASALQRYQTPEVARRWVAPPGSSPHHSGRAIDLHLGPANASGNVDQLRATPVWRWLSCNAGRFGFTPYLREPWHWEFNPPDLTLPTQARPAPRLPSPVPSPARPPRPVVAPPPAAPVRPRQRRARQPRPPVIPPTPDLPGMTPSEMRALRITTTWEGGRPLRFDSLSGDFDGMGLSFGLLQWNIGSGSLQPLLSEFVAQAPQAVDEIFGSDAASFRQMLERPARETREQARARIGRQLAFVRRINDPSGRQIAEPWASRFRRLGTHPVFQQIQLRAVRRRMNAAVTQTRALGLRTERGLALIFDVQTQSGPYWLRVKGRQPLLDQRRAARAQALGRPLTERELLEAIAHVVADTSRERYREDVRRRKMTIVTGRGVVHGSDFDLERDFGLTDRPWEGTAP
jgi:hypothetical protein